MALVVGAIPHSEWQRLTPLLEALGWDSRNASAAESWYQEGAAGTQGAGDDLYVLLHSRPEYCVARAISSGLDLSTSVSTWLSSAEALLACFRGKRARAILVDVDAACANPRSVLGWLFQHSDPFKPMAEYARTKSLRVGSVQDGQDLETNLNLLLAIQAVNQSEGVADLMPYYEASSVPVATGIYKKPVVDLMSTYSRLQNLNQTYAEMQDHMAICREEAEAYKTDVEDYKKQIEDFKKHIEDSKKHVEDSNKRVEDSKKELSEITEKLNQSEEAHAKLKEENQLVTQNLFKVQEELERYYISDKEKATELEALSAKLSESEAERQRLGEQKAQEIEGLTEQLRHAEQAHEALSEQKATELEALSAKLSESEAERQRLSEQKAQEIERLTEQLRHAEQAHEALSEQKATELEALSAKLSESEAERQRFNEQKTSEIEGLTTKLNYTSSELTKYSQDKQKEIAAIRNTINKKDHELVKRAKKIQMLERKVNELDCVLMTVQNSLFWRASFPVRWLLQQLKKLGGISRHNKVKRQAKLIKQSELFDANWYLESYPDVKSSGARPEEHYIRFGGEEGRDPGPYFSSKNYLQANPDVAKAKINPLVHYIKYGKSEGRRLV